MRNKPLLRLPMRALTQPLEQRRHLSSSPIVPALVQDYSLTPRLGAGNMVSIGNVAVFSGYDATHGSELWVTDNSAVGGHFVKDLTPGVNSSALSVLTRVGNRAVFMATFNGSAQWWITDGTASGTRSLGEASSYIETRYQPFAVAGSIGYVATTSGAIRIDGNTGISTLLAGTTGYITQIAATQTNVFLAGSTTTAGNSAGNMARLYSGLVSQTSVSQVGTKIFGSIENLRAGAVQVYFNSSKTYDNPNLTPNGFYSSDGTANGTRTLDSYWIGRQPTTSVNVFGYAGIDYFVEFTSPNYTVFRYDTGLGSQPVVTLPTSSSFAWNSNFGVHVETLNNKAVVNSISKNGFTERFVTDFTQAGTLGLPLGNMSEVTFDDALIANHLYYSEYVSPGAAQPAHSPLLVTDGTASGTGATVSDDNWYSPFTSASIVQAVGSQAYLLVGKPNRGSNLWSYDPTNGQFAPAAMFSTDTGGSNRSGLSLPGGGGVLSGATFLDASGQIASQPVVPGHFKTPSPEVVFPDGRVLFSSTDNHGNFGVLLGDAASTTLSVLTTLPLASDEKPSGFAFKDGIAYFATNTALWRTDGTTSGTRQMSSFPKGTNSASQAPEILTAIGGKVFFSTYSTTGVKELRVAGPSDGVSMVFTSPVTPAGVASPSYLAPTPTGGMYFKAFDIASNTRMLYATDGTDAGTHAIALAPTLSNNPVHPLAAVVNDQMYFVNKTDSTGEELWVTGGDAASTHIVADLTPGAANTTFSALVSVGDTVLFSASLNLTPYRLYRSDGTTAGTTVIDPSVSGIPELRSPLTVVGGTVYYWSQSNNAADPFHPYTDVWRTTGLPGSSELVARQISTGADVISMFSTASAIIYTPEDPNVGTEAYRIPVGDVAAPRIASGVYQYNAPHPSIELRFNEPVHASATSQEGIRLRNVATGNLIPSSAYSIEFKGGEIFVVPTGLLPDGNYAAEIAAGSALDAASLPIAMDSTIAFFVLAGDLNRDRVVDFADLVILAQNYNQSGRAFSQGNMNYSTDGKVDFSDLVILAQHYGTTLAAPLPTLLASNAVPAKKMRPRLAELD